MAAIYDLDECRKRNALGGAVCAFGVFDGVHAGHQFIIGEAIGQARSEGRAAAVVTFDRDPDELFAGEALRKLMTNAQRIDALSSLEGVDEVVLLPFSREFAALSPRVFLDEAFGARNVPAALHVGADFRFGSHAAGSVEDLRVWGAAHGMQVAAHDLLLMEGAPVTSTRIRALLSDGDVEAARALLGHPYSVVGVVQAGRGEGADMGFATANLQVPEALRVLREGVYAAYAVVGGMRYKAAVSVGVSPTFASMAQANVEVHILDFSGDLYGKSIEVQFTNWLRPMIAFETTEELIATVMGNIQWVRDNL